MGSTKVGNAAELTTALAAGALEIEIAGTITGLPMIALPPGVTLRGGTLRFGAKGIRLTADNTLDGVTVETAEDEVAILNDTAVADMGTLTLRDVRTMGQVFLVAEDAVRAGHIRIEGLRIAGANVRGRSRRPFAYGVEALQGALTVWNRQPDPAVTITADVVDVVVGSAAAPIRGSGVFVGGYSDRDGKAVGGTLRVARLRTGEIHTDGGIPSATPDLISGGVFVITGAVVDKVINAGPVTTYGQNDMVLDNWGEVATWTALAAVTSNGPSGIGFVNFGAIDLLDIQGPIRTTGKGARGFNLYDGSLREARFAEISTTGDGSVGIQISKPMTTLSVTGDVTTTGGSGLSLVKGVQVVLEAIALSIKPGGEIADITIGGRVDSSGDGVTAVEIFGKVGHFAVEGGIRAYGKKADAVHIGGPVPGLDAITLTSDTGQELVTTA